MSKVFRYVIEESEFKVDGKPSWGICRRGWLGGKFMFKEHAVAKMQQLKDSNPNLKLRVRKRSYTRRSR